MASPARGLRQVRREQDRRAPELERATTEAEPDRQAMALKQRMRRWNTDRHPTDDIDLLTELP